MEHKTPPDIGDILQRLLIIIAVGWFVWLLVWVLLIKVIANGWVAALAIIVSIFAFLYVSDYWSYLRYRRRIREAVCDHGIKGGSTLKLCGECVETELAERVNNFETLGVCI